MLVEPIQIQLAEETMRTIKLLEGVLDPFIDVPHRFTSKEYSDMIIITVDLIDNITDREIFGANFHIYWDIRNGIRMNFGNMGPFSIFHNSQVDLIRIMNNILTNASEIRDKFRDIIYSSKMGELKKAVSEAEIEEGYKVAEFIKKLEGEIEVGMEFRGFNPSNLGRGDYTLTVIKITPKRITVYVPVLDKMFNLNRHKFACNIYDKIYECINYVKVEGDDYND